MAITSAKIGATRNIYEPEYEAAAKLGPSPLPHLQCVEGDDAHSAKAAYLAGRIGDPRAAPFLALAAGSQDIAAKVEVLRNTRVSPQSESWQPRCSTAHLQSAAL